MVMIVLVKMVVVVALTMVVSDNTTVAMVIIMDMTLKTMVGATFVVLGNVCCIASCVCWSITFLPTSSNTLSSR